MDKKLKLFIICCAIALAAVSSTIQVKADSSTHQLSSNTSTEISAGGGCVGCVGRGTCGVTRNGTILVGEWRE